MGILPLLLGGMIRNNLAFRQPPGFPPQGGGQGSPAPASAPGSNVRPIMGPGASAIDGGGARTTMPTMPPMVENGSMQPPTPYGGIPGLPGEGMPPQSPTPFNIAANPILAHLFGGLGQNQRFYSPNANMPFMQGFGALLPLLMGIMGGSHVQSPQTAPAPATPASPAPQAPSRPPMRGLPGGFGFGGGAQQRLML